MYLVKFCILLFSCIFVVYWYEINKWIDDYDKVFVLILNKKGNIFIVYISMYCFFYLFIFCMSLYIFFFRIENYRLVVKVIIDNKVFYIIFYIYDRGKCC